MQPFPTETFVDAAIDARTTIAFVVYADESRRARLLDEAPRSKRMS